MRTYKTLNHALWIAFLGIMLTACDTDLTTILPDLNLTTFTVKLTDNPTDVEEVNIDLQKVVLRGQNTWDTLEMDTYAGIYNLLDYQDGVTTVIGEGVTTLDYITEIRLVLGDENSVVANGETYELKVPSGSQSGLKVKLCIDLSDVEEYELTLDFDALASLHQTGNGRYILRPVIRPLNPDAQCDDDDDDGDDDDGDDDDEISYEDLPSAIIDYMEENHPNFRPSDVETGLLCDGTEVYYVEGKFRGDEVLLAFELDGTWRETGVEIRVRDIPMAVSEAIVMGYADYQLQSVYRIERVEEDVRYRVELSDGEEEKILIFEEDGALVCPL